MKWDGHTHTPFCYHGNPAPTEQYIERAIALGFERYTLSEHPPLPDKWVDDPQLFRELAMPEAELPDYMAHAAEMKRRYEGQMEITVGLELDYLQGRLDYTERIVDRWEKQLEDVVYSVHYLPTPSGMRCIDFTPADFKQHLLSYYGSMQHVVDEYYNHVEAAIEWAAQLPMRKRLGHINLIEKFTSELPEIDQSQVNARLARIVPLLAQSGVALDVNTAGLRVATCGKPYVPEWFLDACMQQGVACIYGSDAHKPEHVGTGWDWYAEQLGLSR